jgi:carbon storage regulator
MLVLSRKKNESIIINDDITIVVVEIRGDKVRLGVEAPKEVPVHHNEVYEAIRRNMAAQGRGDESSNDRIRRRIDDLRRQISELECQLTDA